MTQKDTNKMSKHRRIKVDFVALYFRDFLPDLMMMSPEERGAYTSLCFKIYDEGGWILNTVGTLSSICGFSEMAFTKVWVNIKRKFIVEDGEISHKRCLEELRKTEKLIQDKRRAGLKSGERRRKEAEQRSNSVATAFEHTPNNETETRRDRDESKLTKTNTSSMGVTTLSKEVQKITDSLKNSSSVSDSFRTQPEQNMEGDMLLLCQELRQLLPVKTNADRTCIDDLARWTITEILSGYRDRSFIRQVIAAAEEARREAKRNKWGYFYDILKRDYGWRPARKAGKV